jgi:hypothetical protein
VDNRFVAEPTIAFRRLAEQVADVPGVLFFAGRGIQFPVDVQADPNAF